MDETTVDRQVAPGWVLGLNRFTDFMVSDFGGGPRPWKFAWVINFQKCGTFFFLGFLMWYYQNFSTAAWVYLAIQGSYGTIWFIKDVAFPDPAWQKKITIGGGIFAFLGVPEYPLPDGAWYALCISMCMIGSVVMIAADAQKYYTLRYQRGLITDGMHRYIRHPNYLGEMLIYGSFALMVWHWLPVLVLAWVWGGLFAVNMIMKEASLSRYPEWGAYKKRSKWLLPAIF